ncbi:ATP-dependent helicase HrpB [Porticoccaceae bacterium LTM1]|nr:ATP-dependent helicase HrpB [Porticoccaceae bacterium LTM1]
MSKPFTTNLPIGEVLDDIRQQLGERHELVLQAEPGAGKTTVVPLALLNELWLRGRKILMLEPRRMAARVAAERMASTLGEKVGETVGYRIRLESRVSDNTKIEVITEGILTRMLQDDPSLADTALVIFDEFHERSLDADFGLALSLQGRELFRDDDDPLKLLVMSATLDGEAVSKLMNNAPIITSEGRCHPVEVYYGTPSQPNEPITGPMVDAICTALTRHQGSVLAFLPGQGEINRVAEALAERLEGTDFKNTVIAPLYGGLSLSEQQLAISICDGGGRKIVLSTNIAETSLTIEGITSVVDSGLAREPIFDPQTGMTRLQTRRISKASSVQRAGRAGRLGPGHCYRLWGEQQQQQLAAQSTPEILQADLAPLVLQLLAWGIDDPNELAWLNPPPSGPFNQARDLLVAFGAAEQTHAGGWQLTAHGEQMANLPAHPRLAHLLLVGMAHGVSELACQLAALMSERDPLSREGADLSTRLMILNGDSRCPAHLKGWRLRILQQAKRYQSFCRKNQSKADLDELQALGLLIAAAYPDRIAKRRNGNNYLLSNGRTATLSEHDSLSRCDWLAVAELGGRVGLSSDIIFSAAEFDPALLSDELAVNVIEKEFVQWVSRDERFVAERRKMVGAIVVQATPIQTISIEAKTEALIQLVRNRGLKLLPWNDELRQWKSRVMLLQENLGDPWPNVSDTNLLNTLEEWLAPYLNDINRLSHFQQLDLKSILQGLLPWPLPQQLDELAPLRLEVPSGSHIQIDYTQSPPVLAVKLQEMFGCQQTPTIANGKVELMIHLLSPARRPLQITQDLAGFWRTGYEQVKKEMKGRYPKHPWPDNPLEAVATGKVKNRL